MHLIDHLPIWLVLCLFLSTALVCVESGFRFGRHRRRAGAHEPEAAVGVIIASTLALLAFVLGFTFNLAASRFEERRAAVLSESNAIGTTYLRADFLEESSSTHVKELLRKYVALRLNQDSRAVSTIIANSESLQNDLWGEAAKAGKKHPDSLVCALFISTLNDLIDIHSKRVAAGLYARVPMIVWLCLLLVSSLAMSGIGYMCGLSGHRSIFGTSTLVISFSLVMFLVADLDRPLQGIIRTPQQPMIDLGKKVGQL